MQASGCKVPLIRFLISALYGLLVHIICFPTHPFFHVFLTYLLPYLSFHLRIDPFRYQAGCHKRRLNLALVFCIYFVLSCISCDW